MQRANDSQGTMRIAGLAVMLALVAACSSSQSVVGEPLDVGAIDVSNDLPSIDRPVEAAADVAVDRADAPADVTDASDAPPGCRSNADCVADGGDAGGGAVCDMTTGRCVGCVPSADTCPGSQHCDPTVMQCVAGCHSDDGCAEGMGSDAGSDGGAMSRRVRCDMATHTCAECVTDAHCGAGQLCVGSICVAGCDATHACPTGQTCCANACVDPQSNIANCGMCGTRCTVPNATPACMNGSCAVGVCTAPFADCDMMASTGCETDTLSSLDHCGGCGMAVPTRDHATRTCTAGRPGFTCEMGFADCNGVVDDGCEVNTASDATHCGSCSTLCNPPNATSACTMGRCTIAMCNTGFGDCDMNPTNGCEVNTNTSSDHCSMCGHSCPSRDHAFPGCIAGTCVISCVAGFQDCNGSDTDGCEIDIRADPRNCGACRRSCTLSNAMAGCAMGDCTIATCNTGFADCDMMVSNGCEVNTQVDESNCGMCGMVCRVAGGTPVCRTGACGVSRCDMGLEDCDMSATNGCEINTQTDVNNCGGCGARCMVPHATASCTAGRCGVAMCDTGFADCNGLASDGCEVDTRTTDAHCGGCGRACVTTHATGGCMASTCVVTACDAGFANCDMNASNGCEVDIRTSTTSCGACGRMCPTGAVCQTGVCTRYPSTGAEGAFSPTTNITLTPGVHNFTTITVPAGVIVRASGTGVLDLRATGDVTVSGSIDTSGGGGSNGGSCFGGAGGQTGTTIAGAACSGATNCAGGAGGGGAAGAAGTGSGAVGLGGANGGGGGGYFGGGGGGGGFSGGVGGAADYSAAGNGRGGGSETGGGGSTLGGVAAPTGGTIAAVCYNGATGSTGTNRDNSGSAGGGGSIGATASADRAVTDATFRTGSGGGGGGGGADEGGCGDGETGGGGGGGGGGALRIATTARLTITGTVQANGGSGGFSPASADDCADDTGQSGGGGSGGVVFLYAPSMTVSGRVTAVGGAGGDFTNNSCGVIGRSLGGTGGLGRIRISVDNVTAGACALGGTFNPPLASGCANNAAICQAYVGLYPD